MVGYSQGYWPGTLRPKYNTHFNAHIFTQHLLYGVLLFTDSVYCKIQNITAISITRILDKNSVKVFWYNFWNL